MPSIEANSTVKLAAGMSFPKTSWTVKPGAAGVASIILLPTAKSSLNKSSLNPWRTNPPVFSLNTAVFNSDIKPEDEVSQNISNKLSTGVVSYTAKYCIPGGSTSGSLNIVNTSPWENMLVLLAVPVPAPDPAPVPMVADSWRTGSEKPTTVVPSAKPPPLTSIPFIIAPPFLTSAKVTISFVDVGAAGTGGGVNAMSTIPLAVTNSVSAISPILFSVDILAISGSEV